MIRLCMIVFSGALVLSAGAMLVAGPYPQPVVAIDDVQITEGEIKSVDTESQSFVLAVGEGREEVTLRMNERTTFTLDGVDSTMEEALREGHQASVTHRNNIAVRVDATSKLSTRLGLDVDDVQIAHGTIRAVDAERQRFILKVGEGDDEMTVRVSERTQYTLDGEESTMEEALREGHHASVSHRNHLAIRVDATTKTAE